jgi:hypothetical protein
MFGRGRFTSPLAFEAGILRINIRASFCTSPLRMLAFPRLPARRLLRSLTSCGLIFRIDGASGATLMSSGMRHSASGSSV